MPELIDDKFEVLSQIGEGGMGIVYRAEHREMDRQVALKLLKVNYASTFEQQVRFKREAQIVSSLSHPNIVSIYSIGVALDGTPYIAMELLEGKPLSELIKDKPMPWREAVPLFIQACAALQHAHQKGVIHRDIKPSNLVIENSSTLKVVDFGIAKVLGGDDATTSNVLVGSVHYLSPGRCAGRPANVQSDIYSLGCSLFEVLTGSPPFAGKTYVEMLTMHRETQAPRVGAANKDTQIPPALEEVIAGCLRKDNLERYQCVGDLQTDLERVLSGQQPLGLPPQAVVMKILSPRLPSRSLVALAVCAGAFITATALLSMHLSKVAPEYTTDPERMELKAQILSGEQSGKEHKYEDALGIIYDAFKKARASKDVLVELEAALSMNRILTELEHKAGEGAQRTALEKRRLEVTTTSLDDAESQMHLVNETEQKALRRRMFAVGEHLSLLQYQAGDSDAAEASARKMLSAIEKGPRNREFMNDAIGYLSDETSRAIEHGNDSLTLDCLRLRRQLQLLRHWTKQEMDELLNQSITLAESHKNQPLAKAIRAFKAAPFVSPEKPQG